MAPAARRVMTNAERKFAVTHLNLARHQAHAFARRTAVPFDDLIGPAYEGLCKAAMGFDGTVNLEPVLTGNAFITEPGPFVDVLAAAVKSVTGEAPILSTTGGISDARFLRKLCPVVELGLVGATMHAVDECTPVQEIEDLTRIYEQVILGYFAAF